MFTYKQRLEGNTPLNYGNNTLKYSSEIKHLGLYIDETVSCENHLNKIKNRLIASVGILKRMSDCIGIAQYLHRSVYFSLIHSQLQYVTILWYSAHSKFTNSVKVFSSFYFGITPSVV